MLGSPGSGRIANGAGPRNLAKEFEVPLLGLLHYDPGIPRAVEKSDVKSLLSTIFAMELRRSMNSYMDGLQPGKVSRHTLERRRCGSHPHR